MGAAISGRSDVNVRRLQRRGATQARIER